MNETDNAPNLRRSSRSSTTANKGGNDAKAPSFPLRRSGRNTTSAPSPVIPANSAKSKTGRAKSMAGVGSKHKATTILSKTAGKKGKAGDKSRPIDKVHNEVTKLQQKKKETKKKEKTKAKKKKDDRKKAPIERHYTEPNINSTDTPAEDDTKVDEELGGEEAALDESEDEDPSSFMDQEDEFSHVPPEKLSKNKEGSSDKRRSQNSETRDPLVSFLDLADVDHLSLFGSQPPYSSVYEALPDNATARSTKVSSKFRRYPYHLWPEYVQILGPDIAYHEIRSIGRFPVPNSPVAFGPRGVFPSLRVVRKSIEELSKHLTQYPELDTDGNQKPYKYPIGNVTKEIMDTGSAVLMRLDGRQLKTASKVKYTLGIIALSLVTNSFCLPSSLITSVWDLSTSSVFLERISNTLFLDDYKSAEQLEDDVDPFMIALHDQMPPDTELMNDKKIVKALCYLGLKKNYSHTLNVLINAFMEAGGRDYQLDEETLITTPKQVLEHIPQIRAKIKNGVYDNITDFMNNNTKKNPVMMVNEFFVLWPFLCGCLHRSDDRVKLMDCMKGDSMATFIKLMKAMKFRPMDELVKGKFGYYPVKDDKLFFFNGVVERVVE